MAPAIFERPSDVPEWSSGWAEGWKMERIELLPSQRLKALIERSPDLAAIIELADSVGPMGRTMALRLIGDKIRKAENLVSQESENSGSPLHSVGR
tara:strand:- start:1199 stop:1486 length:288 start_codon:yes stop_codon:yes gene_type:complete